MIENMTVPREFTARESDMWLRHMRVSSHRHATRADSLRERRLVADIRRAISGYRDVSLAAAHGYEQFQSHLDLPEYHFLPPGVFTPEDRLDLAKPASLLYARDSTGKFVLKGAMYVVSGSATEHDLDRLTPLSFARWHKHINWCMPRLEEQHRWQEKKNGNAVFGMLGVNTRKECDEAGGVFKRDLFGWMVHANVFVSDDPGAIWGGDQMATGGHGH